MGHQPEHEDDLPSQNAGTAAVTGTVVFGSAPVAVGVNANSVGVARQDGKVTEIRFGPRNWGGRGTHPNTMSAR